MSTHIVFTILAVTCFGLNILPVSSIDPKDCTHIAKKDEDLYLGHAYSWKKPYVTNSGDNFHLKCDNGFVENELAGKTEADFVCSKVGNAYVFSRNVNSKYSFSQLLCRSDYHKDTIVHEITTHNLDSKVLHCRSGGLKTYEVKRKTQDRKEKLLYRVCFDQRTMIAKFSMKPASPKERGSPHEDRGPWGFDQYGNSLVERRDLSQAYTQGPQQGTITMQYPESKYALWGKGSKRYPYYFNRGHLAAFLDFQDKADSTGTFEYINAAPQWKSLNDGAWLKVERLVYEVIKNNPEQWDIYTGTYGTIEVPEKSGKVFLLPANENGGPYGKLPVPKMFYKLAYNIKDKTKSKVFVGINEPEFRKKEEITDEYKLCPDKLKIEGDEKIGFYYTCTGKSVHENFLAKLKTVEGIVV